MTLTAKLKSPKRTAIVAIVVVALAAGAAFALLEARGVLLNNSIAVANAGLVVSTDGVHYGPIMNGGLRFGNLVPGGYPGPQGGYVLHLKNNGTSDLDLSFALNDPPSDIDPDNLSNVNLILIDVTDNSDPQSFSLESLYSDKQSMGTDLWPGQIKTYIIEGQATADAQPGVEVDDINLAFIGTARDANAPR